MLRTVIILIPILFVAELLYFKLADRFNIIDKPNLRSSHSEVTIRGGGIIFAVSPLLFFFGSHFEYPCFFLGLFLIALISFLDDVHTLDNKIRIMVHLIAVLLMMGEWGFQFFPWYLFILALIFIIGTINAYNFMDGINGITGVYSLVAVCTLFYVNENTQRYVATEIFIYILVALLVFNFFNFRRKAKCFAGDVGSVSIAFIILFLLGKLLIISGSFAYIFFLLLYGLDAVTTIGFRLIRKENIFEAHRSHFYQFLGNERKIPQLYVALGYGIVQVIINIILVKNLSVSAAKISAGIVVTTLIFIALRFVMEGRDALLKKR